MEEGLIKLEQPATIQTKTTTEYRYSGSDDVVKNYVNFNNEVWRIIGVFDTDDGTGKIKKRIKLIRDKSIGEYSWDSSLNSINTGYGSNQWGESGSYLGSDLMRELNDLYYGSKKGNCSNGKNDETTVCDLGVTGLKEKARSMIGNALWYTGATFSTTLVLPNYYIEERGNKTGTVDSGQSITKTNSWIGKVALMYPSDYGYATNGGSVNNLKNCYEKALYTWNDANYAYCKDNDWLFDSNINQWTLSAHESFNNGVLLINSTGHVSRYSTFNTLNVRPVVYLLSDVKILKGIGSIDDKYEFSL